jgi:lysophospholipase L1-like esterase
MTPSTKPAGILWPAILLLGLIALISLVATELGLYSRNTLQQHPDWQVGKTLLNRPPMGAEATGETRNLLHKNQLHLGVWHGYQELYFHKPLLPQQLSCSVRIGPDGALTILYAVDAKQAEGLRLSRRLDYPSAYLVRDRVGRFTDYRPLPDLQISDDWQQLTLDFQTKSVEVLMNGVKVATLPAPPREARVIAFSGEARDVVVDNVLLVEQSGEIAIREGFRNHGFLSLWPRLLLICLVLAAALVILMRRRGAGLRKAILRMAVMSLGVLGVLVLLLAFDYQIWSRLYPYEGYTPWGHKARFSSAELVRKNATRVLARWDHAAPVESELEHYMEFSGKQDLTTGVWVTNQSTYPFRYFEDNQLGEFLHGDKLELRLLLLGTSQSYGSGAIDPESTLQVQLFDRLSSATQRDVLVFNASVAGSYSGALLRRFKKFSSEIKPDFVVINLSNNDYNRIKFGESLLEIIEFTRELGGTPVLILEPNSPELPSDLQLKHDVMKDVAGRQNLVPVDLHNQLKDLENTGRLWHDIVHLSSYGQDLAAERIAQAVIDTPAFKGFVARD